MIKMIKTVTNFIIHNIKTNIKKISRWITALLVIAAFVPYIMTFFEPYINITVKLNENGNNSFFKMYYSYIDEGFDESKTVFIWKTEDPVYVGQIDKDKFAAVNLLRLDFEGMREDEETIIERITFKNPRRSTYVYKPIDNIDYIHPAKNIEVRQEAGNAVFRITGEDAFIHFLNTEDIIRGAWRGISANIIITALLIIIIISFIFIIPEQRINKIIKYYKKMPGEKILISVAVSFAFSFNFMFFGTMHIFMSNFDAFMLPFYVPLRASVLITIITAIVLSVILLSLPSKIHTVAASLVTGIIIAIYVQGNFLNDMVDLGPLTGDEISWEQYTGITIINTIIWLIIIAAAIIAGQRATKATWKRAILIACGLLSGMQAAALITYYAQNRGQLQYESEYYLSREGAYEVSSLGNIMIFVVDRLDRVYVDAVLEDDPAFFDRLDGFTDFTNAIGSYGSTFPSGTFMTTGVPFDFLQTRVDYFDYAWSNSQFIPLLKEAGYTMKYHMDGGRGGYMYSDINQILGIADNVKDGRLIPTTKSVAGNFITLSVYRFSPMLLKPVFWMPMVTFEYESEAMHENVLRGTQLQMDYVSHNDPLFMELLRENGLNLQNEMKNYFYLHLFGSHAPFTMDEESKWGESNLINQTKGCFNILFTYMDEMKRLGVYEDSTIVILGDHGRETWNIGFWVKPRGRAGTPLAYSDVPISINNNLLATILKSEGLEYDGFGISVFDVNPDIPAERFVYSNEDDYRNAAFYRIENDCGLVDSVEGLELIDKIEYRLDSVTALPID